MKTLNRNGFTLIELLIVVVIVGILASISLPLTELASRRAKEEELRTALRQIRTAIDAYKKAADENRIERAADATGYPPSLMALVEGVPQISDPEKRPVYFLRRLPRDPFAEKNIPAIDTWGLRSHESPPETPVAGDDVFDVFSLSTNSGFNGIPYSQW